jgi:lysophospholipase L1-like esterase
MLILKLLLCAILSATNPSVKKNPNILSGLDITSNANRVTVTAGSCRVGDRTVNVADATTFTVQPSESVPIESESYQLTADKPDRWISGTHLKGCIAGGTALPDCLVPGSVVVKLADGTVMQRDKDYLLDERWAALSRIEGGRIGKDAKVDVSYRIGQMRLDQLVVDPSGKVSLLAGKAVKKDAYPPETPSGSLAVANLFMPGDATNVDAWQIFPIIGPFPEPSPDEIAKRAELVPKTLAKLRAGQPVNIVTWGDSVTVGGDASTVDKRFANLFITQLQERFPGAKITHENAGIGATATPGRLPALQREVLDFHPDLVTIEFVNDMGLPDEMIRANYKSAFEQIRSTGAEVILITPHFTMTDMMGKPHPRGGETRHTVEVLRQVAAQYHVGLADTSMRWAHLDEEGLPYVALLDNGINHPDDRGHELFVKDLLTFFPK